MTEIAPPFLCLGLMSGTSLDGIDAALIETDGAEITSLGACHYRPYSDSEQALLAKALVAGRALEQRNARPGVIAEAEQLVTDCHCEAIAMLMEKSGSKNAVQLIGFHGQTVIHKPKQGLTVQIGLPQKIADRFQIPVVGDFRAADVAAGGEGAPLVPVMHLAMARRSKLPLPCAIVNIGGVANITLIAADESLTAFDCGPGNALLNDFLKIRTGEIMDRDGAIAQRGKADLSLVAKMMRDPFFDVPPPKSLDRDHFQYVQAMLEQKSLEDGAATLTAFTAEALARGLRISAAPLEKIVIAGGGAHNPAMLRAIGQRSNTQIVTADDLGWSGDFLEAQAFAYLAARTLRQLPISFPGTTGIKKPLSGGVLFQPS